MNTEDLIKTYPRRHKELPPEYKEIFEQQYEENRKGKTRASYYSMKIERWGHKKISQSSGFDKKTLEIGAGTLNQLEFEQPQIYDIVEPYKKLFEGSPNLQYVRNAYDDISEIKDETYDRIISACCFEHVEDLPQVVADSARLLAPNGKLCISIPNEGRFLWKLGYTLTTGREFKKRFGLEYETLMKSEHINTADEIEQILKYYFKNVKMSLLGVGKTLSLYRYYECCFPKGEKDKK